MSYTKREWATGNVVGAVDLNRMEQGIEDAGSGQVLVVNSVYDIVNDSFTLDKTWQEIYDAFPLVVVCGDSDGVIYKALIHQVNSNDNKYLVAGNYLYRTTSASGYPTASDGGGGTMQQ